MRYSGSKRKYMKELLPILMNGTDEDTVFIDCFGGGMNVISEIPLRHKYAIELNRYICALWHKIQKNGIQDTFLPTDSDTFTEKDYKAVKYDYINNLYYYSDYFIGFVGSACSYGGAWFNGYAKYNPRKKEDHIKEAYNGLCKQVEKFKYLEDTEFLNGPYNIVTDNILSNELRGYNNVVIYCDPPYFNTKKYESDFNHHEFWNWAREKSKQGYRVYISEYTAPQDFIPIWAKEKKDGMGTTRSGEKQNNKTEKLFIYQPWRKN